MSRTIELTVRLSLWLLFVAAAIHALFVGWVGLTFGFGLWDAQNLSPTLHWVAAIAFPVLLFKLVPRCSGASKQIVLVWLGAWAFVGYYVLFYLGDGHILDCGLHWSC
jgi:hypothetical protein